MAEMIQKINLVWSKIGAAQRVMLIALVLTVVVGGAVIMAWARRPDMRLLYADLAPEDAAKIVDKISEKSIPYELKGGGTSVWVPQEHVYQLRLDMAKDGLAGGQQTGYRIFDNSKIGVSPFVQNVNLKRALQDELAQSIQMIEGVSYARVHIDNPEQGAFSSRESRTRASVVLRLQPGYRVSQANVAAITNLVAGSIAGLETDKVTVVDTQGTLLSSSGDSRIAGAAGTYLDYKQQVETSLQKKVEDMFRTILGPERAVVRISAVIDMNSVSTVTETFVEGAPSTLEETTTKEKEPDSPSADGKTTLAGSTRSDTNAVTKFDNNKTVKQETILPGEIRSLTVSAAVDLRPVDPNATGLVMELEEVKEHIRSALGPKAKMEDITVSNVPLYRPEKTKEPEEAAPWIQYLALARNASMGIMAVCALLALKLFSGAKKKVAVGGEAIASLGAGLNAGMLPAAETSAVPGNVMMQKQIASALQNNPEQVRQLFATWLEQG